MAKKKIRRKRVKRNPRRISAAAGGSLRGAISGLSTYHTRLMHDRAEIDAKISAIESALSAMGTAPARGAAAPRGGRGGGRGVRAGSLKYYIGRVLAGRGVMAVKDITAAVRKAGYKTKNKTLGKSVGIALTQMKDARKVGRGRFKLA
jgi:hypothetical protein